MGTQGRGDELHSRFSSAWADRSPRFAAAGARQRRRERPAAGHNARKPEQNLRGFDRRPHLSEQTGLCPARRLLRSAQVIAGPGLREHFAEQQTRAFGQHGLLPRAETRVGQTRGLPRRTKVHVGEPQASPRWAGRRCARAPAETDAGKKCRVRSAPVTAPDKSPCRRPIGSNRVARRRYPRITTTSRPEGVRACSVVVRSSMGSSPSRRSKITSQPVKLALA